MILNIKTYSQNFILMTVKDMRHEASVSAEGLPCYCIPKSFFLLGHVSNVISLCIHDGILISLLETTAKTG